MRHAFQRGKLKYERCGAVVPYKGYTTTINLNKPIKSASRYTALSPLGSAGRQPLNNSIGCLVRQTKERSSFSTSASIGNKSLGSFHHSPGNTKMRSFIQFMTTPTADTPGTALLLHFDDKRYVIGNIHEGLQRAGLQAGSRFFKARDFFLTGKTEWRSNGGLLGMILTLADSANTAAASKTENAKLKLERQKAREEEDAQRNPRKRGKKARKSSTVTSVKPPIVVEDPTVRLHGGPNLSHIVATARSFIFRHGTPIRVNEFREEGTMNGEAREWEPTWKDERIQVWTMPISPEHGDKSARPSSPRKRSLGEYMDGQDLKSALGNDQWSVNPKASVDQEQRDQQIRDFVVSEMFSSTWRYDNLVETPLHQVVMPAGVYIRDPQTKEIAKYKGPTPDGTTPVPNIKVLVRQPWPGALVDHLPPTKPSSISMSYIIRNHRQRGKFKPEAAKALNVRPGPLWSTLAAGSEVQSSDGKTVTPEMVLEPSEEGAGVAVVELPSREYIPNLVNRAEWDIKRIMNGVGGVIWILGPGVSEDETLRDFMKRKSDLEHIISSPDHCPNCLVQTSAAAAAIRHNQIDPIRFPIPVHSNAIPVPVGLPVVEASDRADKTAPKLQPAKRGLRVDFHPSFGVTEDDVVPHLNTALVVQEVPKSVVNLAQAAQQETKNRSLQPEIANQGLPCQDAEIICLGTGSAVPSPYRNVSSTLLRVPGHGSYLLDCGEDTLGQLKRVFTEAELTEIFHDLKLIWISHLHADHHLGIASVIRAWHEEVHGKEPSKRPVASPTKALMNPARHIDEGKRLFIVAHRNMMRWLDEYSSVEDFGYDQLIPLTSFPTDWEAPDRSNLKWNGIEVGFKTCKDPKLRTAMRKATSLSNLVAVTVNHCYGAQAVSLTFPHGFKFSYSGDCRPSKLFARTGKGSTVLLHEATFDDELIGDAKAKKHSTTSEAIGVGVAMGAKRVLLTHFSQRYQKVPSVASLESLNVQLEEPEETEDPMASMEPPDNIENEAPVEKATPIKESSESLQHNGMQGGNDASTREVTDIAPSTPSNQTIDPVSASTDLNPIQSPAHDMKVGVAFDYMRVKVGDIIHLENFTPAMRELYKEEAEEEADAKLKKMAKKALPGDSNDVTPAEVAGSAASKEGQDESPLVRKVMDHNLSKMEFVRDRSSAEYKEWQERAGARSATAAHKESGEAASIP